MQRKKKEEIAHFQSRCLEEYPKQQTATLLIDSQLGYQLLNRPRGAGIKRRTGRYIIQRMYTGRKALSGAQAGVALSWNWW